VHGPSLSPDGTLLAFVANTSGALRVRPLEDRGRGERVSSKRVDASEASWSPDGTRVAYTAYPTGGSTQNDTQIRVTDITDGTTTVLANERGREEMWPVWSPDGTDIVFSADSERGCDEGPFVIWFSDLFVIPASGGDERRIQVPGADLSLAPVDWHNQQLMISAARWVGATGDPADPCPEFGVVGTAYTMRKDGSDRVERPRAGAFSPDGKWIAYTVGGQVVESIWVSRLDGSDDREVRPVAQNPNWATLP
jgi:Tol biopolymer transport system component